MKLVSVKEKAFVETSTDSFYHGVVEAILLLPPN